MNKHTDLLLEVVHEIAELIHLQCPLEMQDKWLERVIERGIWKPDTAYTYVHECKGKDCPSCGIYVDGGDWEFENNDEHECDGKNCPSCGVYDDKTGEI